MAIKVTNVPKRLAETLVIDTAADATGSGSGDNVFTGTSKATKFYCWRIDGTLVPTAFFIKVQEATSYTCSQKRVSWRRLAVLVLSTGLLAAGLLASDQWLYVALAYIAGDSAEKAMAAIGLAKK